MANFTLSLANGTYTTDGSEGTKTSSNGSFNFSINHQLNFQFDAATVPTAGTMTVSAKAPGSDTWEDLPSGIISFPDIGGLLFQYKVDAYRFVIESSDGVGMIKVTDSSFEV